MIRSRAAALAAFALLLPAAGAAAERAGVVAAAQPQAFQATAAIGHPLAKGDDVFRQARVYTRQYGSVAIDLADGTKLTVAPNASLVIDDYVFAGETRPGTLALTLSRGALRMISGRMPKAGVSIQTPIGTIGVRGTDFWIEVRSEERIWIWIAEGGIAAAPERSGEVFAFDAPTHLTCTPASCEAGEAPPLPQAFPLGGASGRPGRDPLPQR